MDKKTANEMVKKFEEKLQTKEGQEWMRKFCEEFGEKERQKKELVEKTDYINWLENFTKEFPSFSDDTWLYKQDEISKEDYVNVCKISTFFSLIERFADTHYISGIHCDYGQSYYIEYNGKVYEIGTVVGQGAVSFCNTEDINKEANIIRFEEIAHPSHETWIRTTSISTQLSRINDLFKELANNDKLNIPIEAIIRRADVALTDLKKK